MKQLLDTEIIIVFLFMGTVLLPCTISGQSEDSSITNIADLKSSMSEMDFDDLIFHATGKEVIRYDKEIQWHREILSILSITANHVLEKMNAPNSPVRNRRRINEVSRDFEDAMQRALEEQPDWTCEIPINASGKRQRAGYPDLLLTHLPSGHRVYVDPKVYGHHQRKSSLRTFYYEPKPKTSKIRFDAIHLLIGFEHDGAEVGQWQFINWTIVDMSLVQLRLKLEFQTSNRELYQPQSILSDREKSQ